jgi:serine/threonine protein kinase
MRPDHPLVVPGADDSQRYDVERKLGEGGAGSVYLVRDRETGERLALKPLHHVNDSSVPRLKREFRSLANINHRNVVKLYDLGRSQNEWFLTMEYVDGLDLLRHLEAGSAANDTQRTLTGTPDVERIASAFQQLAAGVYSLHKSGVLITRAASSSGHVERARARAAPAPNTRR